MPVGRTVRYPPAERPDVQRVPKDLEGLLFNIIMSTANTDQVLEPDCPTGNCDFAKEYASLGVCSTCRSVIYDLDTVFYESKDEVQLNLDPAHSTQFKEVTRLVSNYTIFTGVVTDENRLTLNQPKYYELRGREMMAVHEEDDDMGIPDGKPRLLANVTVLSFTNRSCSMDWLQNGTATGKRNPDTDCYDPRQDPRAIQNAPPAAGGPTPVLGLERWSNIAALACHVEMCIPTHNATVRAGKKREAQVGLAPYKFFERDAEGKFVGDQKLVARDCVVDGGHHDLNHPLDSSDNYPGEAMKQSTGLVEQCTHALDVNLYQGIFNFLSFFFDRGARTDASLKGQAFNLTDGEALTQPLWLPPLFNNGSASLASVNETFDAVAKAMTTHFRQSDAREASAAGAVYATETCVKAQYLWLILPALLVSGTCVFLVGTIFSSVLSQGPSRMVWKSSILAVLFRGSDFDTRDCGLRESHASLIDEPDSMDEAAKRLSAKLNGWRFEQT